MTNTVLTRRWRNHPYTCMLPLYWSWSEIIIKITDPKLLMHSIKLKSSAYFLITLFEYHIVVGTLLNTLGQETLNAFNKVKIKYVLLNYIIWNTLQWWKFKPFFNRILKSYLRSPDLPFVIFFSDCLLD